VGHQAGTFVEYFSTRVARDDLLWGVCLINQLELLRIKSNPLTYLTFVTVLASLTLEIFATKLAGNMSRTANLVLNKIVPILTINIALSTPVMFLFLVFFQFEKFPEAHTAFSVGARV